jgi:hypothetical protein
MTFIVCLSCLLLQNLRAESKPEHSASQIAKIRTDDQDMPNTNENLELKGLSKFAFFALCPAPTKQLSEKMESLVSKQLKRYGNLEGLELMKKDGAVDFSKLTGATLLYEIKNVTDLEGKELGIIRASLNLSAFVLIEKTKEKSSCYLWSSSCFLQGDVNTNNEALIARSLEYLMEQFMQNYYAVNQNRPVFRLYW